MIDEAIILAGGFGTRLSNISRDIPKPMAPVKGRPFIEYLLDHLFDNNIKHVILSTGYLSHKIEEHFGTSYRDMTISYHIEKEPLGTGGAIFGAMSMATADNVAVLNGDTLFRVELGQMEELHLSRRSDITIALRHTDDASRFGSVTLDDRLRIRLFAEKESGNTAALVNGGFYIFRRRLTDELDLPERFSAEEELFKPGTRLLDMFGFISEGYFIDIGTPEDYARAERELP